MSTIYDMNVMHLTHPGCIKKVLQTYYTASNNITCLLIETVTTVYQASRYSALMLNFGINRRDSSLTRINPSLTFTPYIAADAAVTNLTHRSTD